MGDGISLHDVMNAVSSHLETVLSAASSAPVMDELEAFACHDELLCSLRKQYIDAKDHHRRAVKEYGRHDGMTDMAMMMEDSAWCAMQTRYMELRGNRTMMKKVQTMIEACRLEEARACKAEKEKEALETYAVLQHMARLKKQKNDTALLWVYILLFAQSGTQMFREQTTYQFNRLAA